MLTLSNPTNKAIKKASPAHFSAEIAKRKNTIPFVARKKDAEPASSAPEFPEQWERPVIQPGKKLKDTDTNSRYAFDDAQIELLETDDQKVSPDGNYRLYRHVTLKGKITAKDQQASLANIEIDVAVFALSPAYPPSQTVRTDANGHYIAHAIVMFARAINHIGTHCSTGATVKFRDAERYGNSHCQIANFCRSGKHTLKRSSAHRNGGQS